MIRIVARSFHNAGFFQVPYLRILIKTTPVTIDVPSDHPKRDKILAGLESAAEARVIEIMSVVEV